MNRALAQSLPPRLRCAAIVVFVALTVFSCVKAHHNAVSGVSSDLRTYYTAADDIRHGRTPYVHRQDLNDYIYPPFFCWLFSPLTLLSVPAAAAAWAFINGLMWLLTAWLSLQVAPLPGSYALLPSAFALRLILNNWGHGQVNMLLVAMVVAALLYRGRGRWDVAGALLGAAVAVKIIPGLFVAFHALRREWKLVGIASAVAVCCVLAPALTAGPGRAAGFIRDWLGMFGHHAGDVTIYNTAKNQSLFACLARYLAPIDAIHYPELRGIKVNVLSLDLVTVSRVYLVTLLMLTLALASRLARSHDPALEYSLLFLSLPLYSKTAMEHHWVLLLFVYTVLIQRALERTGLWYAIGASVFLTNFYSPLWLNREWFSRLQALSPCTLAILILWVATFRLLGEPRAGALERAA